MKDRKSNASKSSKATSEQKEKFEKKKAKQVDKDESQFNTKTDEDTTTKGAIFDKKSLTTRKRRV